MPSATPYYNLTIYNNTTDLSTVLVSDYIVSQSGTDAATSNMIKIDNALSSIQTQVLINPTGLRYITALSGATNAYEVVGIPSITAYSVGLGIILNVDITNTATCTLDINALGIRTLTKYDTVGGIVALSAGDLVLLKLYMFIYDGTQWILIGGLLPSDVATITHSATTKTTPVDADEIPLWDSITGLLKKLTWVNLKATLKTYFDTIYMVIVSPGATGNILTSNGSIWTSAAPAVDSRIVGSTTSSATPTINTDTYWMYNITAQAVDITSFTTNLSGTPVDGRKLWISITGTAARAITWGTSFESSTATLPTTTVGTARLDVGFIWNVASSKFRCVAVA